MRLKRSLLESDAYPEVGEADIEARLIFILGDKEIDSLRMSV